MENKQMKNKKEELLAKAKCLKNNNKENYMFFKIYFDDKENSYNNVYYLNLINFEIVEEYIKENYASIKKIELLNIRQEIKDIKKHYIPKYDYTIGINNIDNVFESLLIDELKQYFSLKINTKEFNLNLNKIILFFKKQNHLFEDLYYEFEENSCLIPIYGKQVRELTILKNLENRSEEYFIKFKKWLKEKINL